MSETITSIPAKPDWPDIALQSPSPLCSRLTRIGVPPWALIFPKTMAASKTKQWRIALTMERGSRLYLVIVFLVIAFRGYFTAATSRLTKETTAVKSFYGCLCNGRWCFYIQLSWSELFFNHARTFLPDNWVTNSFQHQEFVFHLTQSPMQIHQYSIALMFLQMVCRNEWTDAWMDG